MKKLLLIIMGVFLAASLCACSGGDEQEAAAPTAEHEVTAVQSAEPEEGASSGEGVSADEGEESRALVVYFSATGNTESLAETIAEVTGAEIFEIIPQDPYTDEDLDYGNDDCRANAEQNDPSARPAIANTIENIEDYDTIYLGYPIWWGTMPKIINTFLESYDLSGKTILPFCTSGGSGIGTSVEEIRTACPDAEVLDGFRGTASSGEEQVSEWVASAE